MRVVARMRYHPLGRLYIRSKDDCRPASLFILICDDPCLNVALSKFKYKIGFGTYTKSSCG